MDETIKKIIENTLKKSPTRLKRKTVGICNEVFEVTFQHGDPVILRIGKNNNLLMGSSRYIPLFEEREVNVPKIIKEDYSLTEYPYPYQILSKLEGKDLGDVFDELTVNELDDIAKSISDIFNLIKTIPTDGRFGEAQFDGKGQYDSWSLFINSVLNEIKERNTRTKIIDPKLVSIVTEIIGDHQVYFDKVKSVFFFDDINSKNVMVEKGKLVGLVDLDSVCYGDPLFAVGSIVASWPDSKKGMYYSNAVFSHMGLSEEEKRIVMMYAVLHRLSWLSENGIQFNANTTVEIDRKKVARSGCILKNLIESYKES